jgi:hypothetical protein
MACFAIGVSWIIWLRPYVVGRHGDAGPYYAIHVAALGGAALVVGLWHCRSRWPNSSGIIGCALGVFCAGDWLWSIHLQAPVYSMYGYQTEEMLVRSGLEHAGLLLAGAPPPRISFNPGSLCENGGMTEGFSTYNSYANPSLSRVWNYLHVATGVPESTTDFIRLPESIDEKTGRLDSLNLVANLDRGSGLFDIHAATDPRAYVVFDVEPAPDWTVAEEKMASGFNFHERALLDAGIFPGLRVARGPHAGSAEINRFDNDRVAVRVRADSPGILVLAEAWYPGWRAVTHGREADVFPANGWMRGVVVPVGENEIVLSYHPQSLAMGLWISLLGGAALAALLLSGPRSSPGTSRTSISQRQSSHFQ